MGNVKVNATARRWKVVVSMVFFGEGSIVDLDGCSGR